MISKEKIKELANLAKISLTEKEIERLQRDIDEILRYVKKLKEVNVKGIEPMSHPIFIKNIMREDEAFFKMEFKREKIFEQFSESKGGFLKVKKII